MSTLIEYIRDRIKSLSEKGSAGEEYWEDQAAIRELEDVLAFMGVPK